MQANSVQCTVCIKWIHKLWSGIHGDLSLIADDFRCKRCDVKIQEADLCERPREGEVADMMLHTRNHYHYLIRGIKKNGALLRDPSRDD